MYYEPYFKRKFLESYKNDKSSNFVNDSHKKIENVSIEC